MLLAGGFVDMGGGRAGRQWAKGFSDFRRWAGRQWAEGFSSYRRWAGRQWAEGFSGYRRWAGRQWAEGFSDFERLAGRQRAKMVSTIEVYKLHTRTFDLSRYGTRERHFYPSVRQALNLSAIRTKICASLLNRRVQLLQLV